MRVKGCKSLTAGLMVARGAPTAAPGSWGRQTQGLDLGLEADPAVAAVAKGFSFGMATAAKGYGSATAEVEGLPLGVVEGKFPSDSQGAVIVHRQLGVRH